MFKKSLSVVLALFGLILTQQVNYIQISTIPERLDLHRTRYTKVWANKYSKIFWASMQISVNLLRKLEVLFIQIDLF